MSVRGKSSNVYLYEIKGPIQTFMKYCIYSFSVSFSVTPDVKCKGKIYGVKGCVFKTTERMASVTLMNNVDKN